MLFSYCFVFLVSYNSTIFKQDSFIYVNNYIIGREGEGREGEWREGEGREGERREGEGRDSTFNSVSH